MLAGASSSYSRHRTGKSPVALCWSCLESAESTIYRRIFLSFHPKQLFFRLSFRRVFLFYMYVPTSAYPLPILLVMKKYRALCMCVCVCVVGIYMGVGVCLSAGNRKTDTHTHTHPHASTRTHTHRRADKANLTLPNLTTHTNIALYILFYPTSESAGLICRARGSSVRVLVVSVNW